MIKISQINLALFLLIIGLMVKPNGSFKCDKHGQIEPKSYMIDLDKEPRERFKEVSNDFKENVWEWFKLEKKRIDEKYLPIIEYVAAQVDNIFPHPFNEEMKGIAEVLNCSVGDVVIANLIYDLTAFCTSIVTQKQDGQIIHGRNFDYDFSDSLQNLTYVAKFYRNGSLLFTSASLAGYIGVVTGHKYKSFTFSINERDQGEWWVNLLFAILDKKASPLSFLTRNLMENITSYDQAVNLLSKSDLIAPAYFIVGGVEPEQGTVITRDQYEVVNVWKLNSSSAGIEKWYLLETNYDHWLPPPADDDRRTPGMKAMNLTTQANINFDTLLDVLTINPVCNNETVYSVVMSAANDDEDGFKIIIH